ncbi:helix-turn-helix transcriptional regulator [Nocardioides glacieisoli]|uniref:Helix-turn-helix transcriptional regulator n=1 Tax=Nocardioides glacieisoli TaxID=1168730 RepID=A0A4Q2RUA3_9ACTN|nr:helix-turn-helix transcriptional regulator [Nocardioides glacieisoli]RYB92418.1 helix-turn-helix transcriptional regulator [Nocardioides glacieisoli]
MEAPADELEAGRRALALAHWALARKSLEAVLAADESAEAREGLGLALWFLGDVAGGIDSRSRAFELYAAAGRCGDAARTAVWVSHQHVVGGRQSAARGWLGRAERALEAVVECEGHGWVAVEKARHAAALEDRISHGLRAVDIARRLHAGDLEVFALSVVGRARVEAGQVEDGLLLLEEAMAGATGGQVGNVHTLAEAYCNLILASTSAGDWVRANEWCQHVDAFARTHTAAPLFGTCRGVHADVLFATGHWVEAEQALDTSLVTLAGSVPELAEPSVASLAELRVGQDRLAEAEALLVDRKESPAALRVLALLRLAQHRPEVAVVLLDRALRQAAGGVVGRARVLLALVEARVELADLPGAHAAARELSDLARASGISVATAQAELAHGRVARAEGRTTDAAEHARAALSEFSGLAMPVDAAEARLQLARALRDDAPDVAEDEARTALAVFEKLGAVRSAAATRAFLASGSGGERDRSSELGPLTPRELEVLELVAQGLSNAAIAATLVISEKTAGHHVSHILTKLGVHNRTEAAGRLRRP